MEEKGKDAEFLKKLLATFKAEAAEHVAAISTGLLELEAPGISPDSQAAIIEKVFRESHSMKGAARAVNLSTIETVCQSFEDVLSALKRKQALPSKKIIDLLHQSASILGELISSIGEKGLSPERERIRDLLRDFEGIMKHIRVEKKDGVKDKKLPPVFHEAGSGQHLKTAGHSSMASSDTIRISKQKLDTILLQTESLLTAKQALIQRADELRQIRSLADSIKKEFAKLRTEVLSENGTSGVRSAGGRHTAGFSNGDTGSCFELIEKYSGQVSHFYNRLLDFGKALEHDSRSVSGMVDGLMDDVKTASMLPFSSVLEIMPKMVRDLANSQGKEASLRVTGAEIEIDRRVLDEIREPLIHLLRNSVDHGIEKREIRIAKKKDPAGSVRVDISRREGKAVEVLVSDDGAGIDIGKIRDSALRLKLISREEANKASREKIISLAFRSGVTTSPIITDLSGRGLGLSIVQEKIEKLGGSVFCGPANEGVFFRMLLPLTLATFRGILVRTAGQEFVIPLAGFDCAVRIKKDGIKTIENRETIFIENQAVPLLPLNVILEMPRPGKPLNGEFLQAVVLGERESRIAFSVDEVLHEQEILVKDLGNQLVRVRNVIGAAVLGTGRLVAVLNIPDLLKSALKAPQAVPQQTQIEEEPEARRSILVVEDSITARTLLKNILESAGYDVKTAVDGADAFAMLRTEKFDLVASDVDMPRMNGFELISRIRADKQLADLPAILVTALESREDRERGIDVGANAYIVKSSFDQSNLLDVIKRLL